MKKKKREDVMKKSMLTRRPIGDGADEMSDEDEVCAGTLCRRVAGDYTSPIEVVSPDARGGAGVGARCWWCGRLIAPAP
jgi:hypothetical protein